MKHHPQLAGSRPLRELLSDEEIAEELLERIRRGRAVDATLLTEDEVLTELRSRLDGRRGEHGRLAQDLDVSPSTLSNTFNGTTALTDQVARKLGFRKVVRFERIA